MVSIRLARVAFVTRRAAPHDGAQCDRPSRAEGPAALELFHHALAPVAQLPVLEVVSGVHILSDLTLGLGTVIHDYLA